MEFIKSLQDSTSTETVIVGLLVTVITMVGIIVTMWFRHHKVRQGAEANRIAAETLRVTLNANKPSIAMAAKVIKKPHLPLENNASFTTKVTITNAGEKNITVEQVRLYLELRKSSGAFDRPLGVHKLLKQEMPVVEPAKAISKTLEIVVGHTAPPRVKIRVEADVRVGSGPVETIETDSHTDFIY